MPVKRIPGDNVVDAIIEDNGTAAAPGRRNGARAARKNHGAAAQDLEKAAGTKHFNAGDPPLARVAGLAATRPAFHDTPMSAPPENLSTPAPYRKEEKSPSGTAYHDGDRSFAGNNKTLVIAVINTLIATIFALSVNYYTENRIRTREVRKNASILYSDMTNSGANNSSVIAGQDRGGEAHVVLEVPHSGLLGSATENFLIYLNGLRDSLSEREYSGLLEYYNNMLTLEAVRKKYLFYQISGYTPDSKPMKTSYASYRELVREADRLYGLRGVEIEKLKTLFVTAR